MRSIDPRLPAVEDDWRILLFLHLDERPWDGLITTDSGILTQPKELAVLMQTRLTLVVASETGHDPIKASGLLLAYLPGICERTYPSKAQVWALRAVQGAHREPWDMLRRVAEHQSTSPERLMNEARLPASALGGTPDDALRDPQRDP